MNHGRWIVVGTDFSEGADCALEHALRLAADGGASIALVHAFEDSPGALSTTGDGTAPVLAKLEDAIMRCGAKEKGIHVEPVVRRGAPWDKIVNVAADMGADLIVVGAHGQRRFLPSFLIGSVVTRVVATSRQSVVVVRPPRNGG